MVDIKSILNAGVSLQAGALAMENVKLLKKKKRKTSDFMRTGMTNIVGASLLQSQANIIGGL